MYPGDPPGDRKPTNHFVYIIISTFFRITDGLGCSMRGQNAKQIILHIG